MIDEAAPPVRQNWRDAIAPLRGRAVQARRMASPDSHPRRRPGHRPFCFLLTSGKDSTGARPCAQLPNELLSIVVRQSEIHDDQFRLAARRLIRAWAAVEASKGSFLLLQRHSHKPANVRLVFNDQDAWLAHRAFSRSISGGAPNGRQISNRPVW